MVEDEDTPLEAHFTARPRPLPDCVPADAPQPDLNPSPKILLTTSVSLWIEGGERTVSPRPVLAALTADALWIQDTWQLRQIPLPTVVAVQTRRNETELTVTLRPEAGGATLWLTFARATQGQCWCKELNTLLQQLPLATPPGDRVVSGGVALVQGAQDLPHVVVGKVECTARTARLADRGLQLCAGMLGADTVLEVWRQTVPNTGEGVHHVSGQAVRVEDEAARRRLRRCWFAQEVGGLVKRMLQLLVAQAALLFIAGVFCAGASRFHPATGETALESLASTAQGLGVVCVWPLVLLAFLRILCWPQLLRGAGLGILAATTLRGLTVLLSYVLALRTTGATLTTHGIWLLLDPFDWVFIILGVVLCVRAWRLADDAPHILPQEVRQYGLVRSVWARILLGLTAVYALGLLGMVAYYSYQTYAYLLQPGVDPRREQEAAAGPEAGRRAVRQGGPDRRRSLFATVPAAVGRVDAGAFGAGQLPCQPGPDASQPRLAPP